MVSLLLTLGLAAPPVDPATSPQPPAPDVTVAPAQPSPTAAPATSPAPPPASAVAVAPAAPAQSPPAAPTTPPSPPPAPTYPPTSERVRFDMDDRLVLAIGVGGGARFDTRRYGDPAGDRASHGRVVEDSGMADLRFRMFAYDEQRSRSGKYLVFARPDLHTSFLFGGTVAGRDEAAIANDHPIRRQGGFFGLTGTLGGTLGMASPGRAGGYMKGSLTMFGLIGGTTEGAYIMTPLGFGTGLRVAVGPVTLMLGPKIDGVLGGHAISGPRLVLQLAPGGDLSVLVDLGHKAFLHMSGTADLTAVGRRFGGQRTLARGTLDIVFPVRPNLRLSVFATYRALHVAGTPGADQFPAEGMTLTHQVMLLGLGVGG